MDVGSLLTPIVAVVAMGVAALVIVWVLRGRRSKKRGTTGEVRPDIAVSQLGEHGPRSSGPCLEIRGIAVRVAAVVVAPLGRGTAVPRVETWFDLLESVVPGLAEVVRLDQALLRPWPGQISRDGFLHSVCSAAALPGDRGRDTPWCMVAGKTVVDGRPLMVALVARAAKPNSLIPIYIENEGQWADVLRIRPM